MCSRCTRIFCEQILMLSCSALGLSLQLSNVKFFVNDECTRSFAALCVEAEEDVVGPLIAHIDAAVTAFGGHAYYKVRPACISRALPHLIYPCFLSI